MSLEILPSFIEECIKRKDNDLLDDEERRVMKILEELLERDGGLRLESKIKKEQDNLKVIQKARKRIYETCKD